VTLLLTSSGWHTRQAFRSPRTGLSGRQVVAVLATVDQPAAGHVVGGGAGDDQAGRVLRGGSGEPGAARAAARHHGVGEQVELGLEAGAVLAGTLHDEHGGTEDHQ